MAFLYVNEFQNIGTPGLNIAQTPPWPPLASYQVGVTAAITTASQSLNALTKLIELTSDTALSFNIGISTSSTATVIANRMPANQTRYYVLPAGQTTWWVSAIANT